MPKHPEASIIICTYKRPDILEKCLESIQSSNFTDYEVIIDGEEGELAKVRNRAASRATGKYLIFIDDDVICTQNWLNGIVETFERDRLIGGVSGPSIITREYRYNRDIFSFKFFKWLYDIYFCEGRSDLPGHITKSGAWTTGASNADCQYVGEVEFLEACNMSYRADTFKQVGGFDEFYRGVGDWSEPDLSYRIRQNGYKLWFNPKAKLYHNPSKTGAFKKRTTDGRNRLANYYLFSSRWVKPCLSHTLYKWFLNGYYQYKSYERFLDSATRWRRYAGGIKTLGDI